MKRSQIAFAALFAAVLCAGATTLHAEDAVPAITKPSKDVTLSFSRPGRVMDVPVKDGDAIKQGQLVAKQDDREEKAAYDYDEFKSKDITEIEVKKAILKQKEADLEQKVKTGVSTRFEIDNSKLEVTIAEANVKLAQFQHEQDARKFEQSKAAFDKQKLLSPIDGVVEQLIVKAGEGVDQQTKLMRIVNIDPLWVEAPVKLAQARTATKGDAATVTFSDGVTRAGNIIFIANVADAASDTLLIRVEVPNPKKLPAGERVTVTLEEKKKPTTASPTGNTEPKVAQDAVKPTQNATPDVH